MKMLTKLKKIDRIIGKSLKVNVQLLANAKYSKLVEELIEETSFLDADASITNRVYCVYNNITEKPRCACGGYLNFLRFSTGYYGFCGKTCTAKTKSRTNIVKEKFANISEEEKNEIVEKRKKTNIEKYGVDNFFKNPEFIKNNYIPELVAKRDANRVKSMQEKHGVDNVFQLDSIKKKIEYTCIEKYGYISHTQKHLPKETVDTLKNKEKMEQLLSKNSYHYVAKKILNCDSTTVMKSINDLGIEYKSFNISTEEQVITEILESYGVIGYLTNDKSVLGNNKELDFYFPDHNYAVEVNGVYWHSERVRPDRKYHQEKYDIAESKGIKLMQFWDFEINNKPNIVASMIINNVNKSEFKVYAKHTTIKELNANDASTFITVNHLQDIKYNNINLAYGLYHGDDLISVMSFAKNRNDYILNRFCNQVFYNVVGGFTKLLTHFTRTHNFDSLVSFSDDRYSNGAVYSTNGFKMTDRGDITYYYTQNHTNLIHKSNFRKSKLKDLFENYNPELTELQNMNANGWHRVNGCRIKKWEYIIKKDL